MKTVTIKSEDPTGAALVYAMRVADGRKPIVREEIISTAMREAYANGPDWDEAGRIIEREDFEIFEKGSDGTWSAGIYKMGPIKRTCTAYESGPTLLIAAMRCFVASKLGDDVEIPASLVDEAGAP